MKRELVLDYLRLRSKKCPSELAKKPERSSADHSHMRRAKSVVDRFASQDADPFLPMELHGFYLKPAAFFERNPAIDLPRR